MHNAGKPPPQPNALTAAAAICPRLRDSILSRAAIAEQILLHDTDGANVSKPGHS
jgi:hypothetical protein